MCEKNKTNKTSGIQQVLIGMKTVPCLENICLGGLHPPSISPSLHLSRAEEEEQLIINTVCFSELGKKASYFWSGFYQSIFLSLKASTDRPGLHSCASHLFKSVQIGQPTQAIKSERRFCSTWHFCLTREEHGHIPKNKDIITTTA